MPSETFESHGTGIDDGTDRETSALAVGQRDDVDGLPPVHPEGELELTLRYL